MTGARVFTFPAADVAAADRIGREVVERQTGFPFVDFDPEKIAIFFKVRSWARRRSYLESMIVDSLAVIGKIADASDDGQDNLEVYETVLLAVHERIGLVLNHLEADKSVCRDSAAIFLCSASPDHRSAARSFCNEQGWSSAFHPPHIDGEMFPDGNPLVMALRMSAITRPGLSVHWRQSAGAV